MQKRFYVFSVLSVLFLFILGFQVFNSQSPNALGGTTVDFVNRQYLYALAAITGLLPAVIFGYLAYRESRKINKTHQ